MQKRARKGGLSVAENLCELVENEILPGVDTDGFWRELDAVIHDLSPKNRALLALRDELQAGIDAWHEGHEFELEPYRAFLQEIGYLVPEGDDFRIETDNVDPEIAAVAGPQLIASFSAGSRTRWDWRATPSRWASWTKSAARPST